MRTAASVLEHLKDDLGGNRLDERIHMEVLRLRGEGQEQLSDDLAALAAKEGIGQ